MGEGSITDQELSGLVEQTAEAASAFIRGDMRRYLELIHHSDDYTLMAPFGGETRRGFDSSVFRRDGTGWQQVHRHADPLVHGITIDQLAQLARG
jgi:hypothetical protein